MSDTHFPSLTQLWPAKDGHDEVEVEIIAVHGLGANPETTWKKGEVNWLSSAGMLPAILPHARIWTFNYESMWIGDKPLQRLEPLGRQLFEFIDIQLGKKDRKPIVFVAHSFGGILLAQALILKLSTKSYRQMVDSVKGIVFLGTPFRGSEAIPYATLIANAAAALRLPSSTGLLKELYPESTTLIDLINEFSNMARQNGFEIACFFEQCRQPLIKNLWWPLQLVWKQEGMIIVPESAAYLDTYPKYPLSTSHTGMNEFDHPEDGNYQLVAREIEKIVQAPQRQPQGDPIFLVPYLENDEFVGREDILKEIKLRMGFEKGLKKRLGLWGLGGIGKTQIVTRFAYSIKESCARDGVSVFFIRAATRERFNDSYLELANHAGIKLPDNPADDKLRVVANWLRSRQCRRWLMILDNADDITLFESDSGLSDYIPLCEHGLVLITSRFKSVCTALAGPSSHVHITEMGLEDCRDLLAKNFPSGNLDDKIDDKIDELISTLEYLPLALTQAAAFMENNTMPVSKYLLLYNASEENRIKLLGEQFKGGEGSQENAQKTVAGTWVISFNQIEKRSPKAADMLAFMSFLDRQDIPRDLLPGSEGADFDFEFALGILQGYAMITRSSDGKAFDMHGLIQLSIRRWLRSNNTAGSACTQVLTVLNDNFPDSFLDTFPDCRKYIVHVQTTLQLAHETFTPGSDTGTQTNDIRKEPTDFQRVRLFEIPTLFQLTHYFRHQNQTSKAISLAERAFQNVKLFSAIDEIEPLKLGAMHVLATVYDEAGRLSEAEKLLFEIISQYLQDDHQDGVLLMTCVRRLVGILQQGNGSFQIDESEIDEFKSMSMEGLDGSDEENIYIVLANWALLRAEFGNNVEDYAPVLEEAIQGLERIGKGNHRQALDYKYVLATMYLNLRRTDEALELFLHIRRQLEMQYGSSDPRTLAAEVDLIRIYKSSHRMDEARNLSSEVFQKRKETLGDDHPDTQESLRCFRHLHGMAWWDKGFQGKHAEMKELVRICDRL